MWDPYYTVDLYLAYQQSIIMNPTASQKLSLVCRSDSEQTSTPT